MFVFDNILKDEVHGNILNIEALDNDHRLWNVQQNISCHFQAMVVLI